MNEKIGRSCWLQNWTEIISSPDLPLLIASILSRKKLFVFSGEGIITNGSFVGLLQKIKNKKLCLEETENGKIIFLFFCCEEGVTTYFLLHFYTVCKHFFSSTTSLILWDLCDEIKHLNELKVSLLLVWTTPPYKATLLSCFIELIELCGPLFWLDEPDLLWQRY